MTTRLPQDELRGVILSDLDDRARDDLDAVAEEAQQWSHRPVREALSWANALGPRVTLPAGGGSSTCRRWEVLATVAAIDVTLARVLEPHLDALAILAEADAGPVAPPDATYGVYAAEGPGSPLQATEVDGEWMLSGLKPWCSLAAEVSHALLTAWLPEGGRGLFVIDLHQRGVHLEDAPWVATGLRDVVSSPVRLAEVPGTLVGGPGWYIERDGFAWGGIGVAAVWYGAAVGIARRLLAAARAREPDQIMLVHIGAVHAALETVRAVLVDAARDIDSGALSGADGRLRAALVRQVAAAAAEEVITRVGHALGPGPLTQEAGHARRVADLTLYVRQHHAERDQAALGRLLLDTASSAPW